VAYLIPCHRVIRKTGAFGNYHWGAARKVAMLMRESGTRGADASAATASSGIADINVAGAAQHDFATALG
jgi:AraC family transcriptional regulator of adaptative response/methylated-DNA-[protein]-cysteine methyltransferase